MNDNQTFRLSLLRLQIEEAFKSIPYPGDDYIAVNKYDEDLENLVDFKGKHWSELTPNWLWPEHHSALTFFTPEAFLFYLPAYMLATAEAWENVDVVGDGTIMSLTVPEDEDSWTYENFFERIELFTLEQKLAVRAFLEYILETEGDCYGLERSLNEYWRKIS